MSFDRYFDSSAKMSHQSKNSDDWYSIVEEALFAADRASRQHRQQLEVGLMKPLPVIPEDEAADSPDPVKELYLTCRPISATTADSHQKGAHSKRKSSPWTDDEQCYVCITSDEQTISRRPSSVYSTEIDSPLSLESFELDIWASDVCATVQSGMSSLRSKPYTRQSSVTSSAVSRRSMSPGSSVLASRLSASSSVYSTDTSVDSYGSPAQSACMHSRNLPANSETPPRQVRSEEEEDSRTSFSFFDFSDSDEEGEEVTVARPESSASNYVKHLRRKALSLRMPTSRKSQVPLRILSVPSKDGPGLSTRFFRSTSTDRSSMLSVGNDIGMENELMAGAAASAKAKRVLGLR
jgi:hypothetical protein